MSHVPSSSIDAFLVLVNSILRTTQCLIHRANSSKLRFARRHRSKFFLSLTHNVVLPVLFSLSLSIYIYVIFYISSIQTFEITCAHVFEFHNVTVIKKFELIFIASAKLRFLTSKLMKENME